MARLAIALVTLAVTAACSGSAPAQAPVQAEQEPGWTGRTNPTAVIAARQALMGALEFHMEAIDTYTVDDTVDPDEVIAAAEEIQPILLAVPHLFPPTTNLYDPDSQDPVTTAMPAIWEDFPDFYAKATAAHSAAMTLAGAIDADELRAGSLGLRAACDACHKQYLLPYERGKVTDEDLEFDFDALFEDD